MGIHGGRCRYETPRRGQPTAPGFELSSRPSGVKPKLDPVNRAGSRWSKARPLSILPFGAVPGASLAPGWDVADSALRDARFAARRRPTVDVTVTTVPVVPPLVVISLPAKRVLPD